MEMHQVRYFLAVAQELNFSRAAEKCNVSQPSLSRAIQQLEAELGGHLFHRERHLTHLTDLGQMVRPDLETVYNAAVQAKQLSQDLSELKRVPLKLGIMSTISPDRSKRGMRDLNCGSAMQTPRTCGIACLPVTLRPLSTRCQAKKK
jgi:LysR family hydrogen peroxide-inducible transcriptional activator